MTLAATESIHYANAAAAAFEADDAETTQRCVHALKGLARNFEAADVGEKSGGNRRGRCQSRIGSWSLLAIANAWAAAAKAGII